MKFKTITIFFVLLLLIPLTLFSQSSPPGEMEDAHVTGHENSDLRWGPCPAFMPDDCRISVLNGSPDQPNADIFFKAASQSVIPEHTHTSAERMVLVSGEMQVNYEGQQPEVLTVGDYGYGPPEKPHTATCLSDDPCVLFIAFEEPIDAFPVNNRD